MSATRKAQRAEVVKWRDTRCAKILGTTQSDTSYYHDKSLVMSTGEQVGLNGHAIFQRSGKVIDFWPSHARTLTILDQMSIGRICEILISPDTGTTVERVALQHFSFGPALHPSLFLPCLKLMSDEIVLTAAVSSMFCNRLVYKSYLTGYCLHRQCSAQLH